MGEFFNEGANCHDTYVNLVNDELAAIKITDLVEFESIIADLEAFYNNKPCLHPALNDLLKIIDPEYGYVHPEHLAAFTEKILKQRIKSFINDFSETESRLNYLQSLKSKANMPSVQSKNNKIQIASIKEEYQIHQHTLAPEYMLIVKIVDTIRLIFNGNAHENELHEIYNTLGLPNHTLIPENTDSTTIESTLTYLYNLKALLDASTFTIKQFLSFDKDMRLYLITYPNTILGDEDNSGIDVLTADEDTLYTFIKCKQFIMDITLNKERHREIVVLFQNLGIMQCLEATEKTQLEIICNTISHIISPFKIELMLYNSFDPDTVNLTLANLENFRYVISKLKLCPVKLLHLSEDTVFNIYLNHNEILKSCQLSGISTTDLIALPKDQVAMILNNEYYVSRLPVLTRAYFLTAQQFLDADLTQKQNWLQSPCTTKLLFNKMSTSCNATQMQAALGAIYEKTNSTLNKLVATEALLYLKDLAITPWEIALQLQKSGLAYTQCRIIFKTLSYINDCFFYSFIGRFTKKYQEGFSNISLDKNYRYILLKFGTENARVVYEKIDAYLTSLQHILDITAKESLPEEFLQIVNSTKKNEAISRIAAGLHENNIFCKHLRLYKATNHEMLGDKIKLPDMPYVSSMYYSGDIEIFSMLCKKNLDINKILAAFQAIDYDSRNTQEISVFGYAVKTDNFEIINKIVTSIKRRSKTAIQEFLFKNGFSRTQPSTTLFAFNNHMILDDGIINAVHQDTGDTPLLTAIRFCNSSVALGLIIWGADLDIRDTTGLTPEMLAAKLNLESIVLDINYKVELDFANSINARTAVLLH